MRRLPLAIALALVALLLVPAGGAFARTTGARDRSSARTASNAWLRFARAGLRTLPAARKRLDAFSASISSDCPNVLASMNATPPDQLDWEVVNNLAGELVYDADITASQPLRAPFERFASKIGHLRWSSPVSRSAVKTSIQLQRRYLVQKPSAVCADARALAADPNRTPIATLSFIRTASRNVGAAGLRGLQRTLLRVGTRTDGYILRAVSRLAFQYQLKEGSAAFKQADDALRVLGLTEPQKVMQQDADAESNARNMVSQVESCYTEARDYSRCRNPKNTGLPMGNAPGQVEVSAATRNSYVVVGHSASGTDFTITRSSSARITRTCNRPKIAACAADGTW